MRLEYLLRGIPASNKKLEVEVGAGLGAEQNVKNEGATKEVHVECGVGEVQIKFVE